jgi:hypothetical protein
MRAQQWEEIAPDVSETLELPGVLKEMQAPPGAAWCCFSWTPSWNDRDTSMANIIDVNTLIFYTSVVNILTNHH